MKASNETLLCSFIGIAIVSIVYTADVLKLISHRTISATIDYSIWNVSPNYGHNDVNGTNEVIIPTTNSAAAATTERMIPNGTSSNIEVLPLKPPFRIVQLGEPRSASTFQTTLLFAIATLKSPPNTTIISRMNKPPMSKITSFVGKTHQELSAMDIVEKYRNKFDVPVHVFTSGHEGDPNGIEKNHNSLHHQVDDEEFYACSLCEIDKYYKKIFDLTEQDIKLLKEYMGHYEILRQCCGLQQSKYNRYRLHGCNVTELLEKDESIHYPWCERHDLPTIEKEFDAIPVFENRNLGGQLNGKTSKILWSQPGDCKKFDDMIKGGRDFNGQNKFKSCDTFLDQFSRDSIKKRLRRNGNKQKRTTQHQQKRRMRGTITTRTY